MTDYLAHASEFQAEVFAEESDCHWVDEKPMPTEAEKELALLEQYHWERCHALPTDIHYVVTVALKTAMTYLYHAREAPTTASSAATLAQAVAGHGLVRRLLGVIVHQWQGPTRKWARHAT